MVLWKAQEIYLLIWNVSFWIWCCHARKAKQSWLFPTHYFHTLRSIRKEDLSYHRLYSLYFVILDDKNGIFGNPLEAGIIGIPCWFLTWNIRYSDGMLEAVLWTNTVLRCVPSEYVCLRIDMGFAISEGYKPFVSRTFWPPVKVLIPEAPPVGLLVLFLRICINLCHM